MLLNKNFGVIGGDLRQLEVAKKLKEDGNPVLIYGFDNIQSESLNIKTLTLEYIVHKSDYLIFPVPVTRDGININAPLFSSYINIKKDICPLLKSQIIFGGIITPLAKAVNNPNIHINDYYNREDFMIHNALLTAEGAIKIALNESKKTINKSKCLVIGYGRIGKILSKLLKNLGASVTISARSLKDISWAKINEHKTINVNNLEREVYFDLVFNTVPAIILDSANLPLIKISNLIIDLASAPGGIDMKIAEVLGIKVKLAPGLPGKFFPESAGKIIVETIYKIIKEENL